MKGKIPDLSKPTKCMLALRNKRAQSIENGRLIPSEISAPCTLAQLAEIQRSLIKRWNDFAEIARQMG